MPVAAPQLVGRDEELGATIRLLDAGEQLPGVAVLAGEAGIGKTALWLAGVDAAGARGYRILSSRPSEAETTFSFAGLTDLLGTAAVDVLPELPPIQRRALEAALLLGESGLQPDDRAVAAAFLGAVRLLAADAPVCLAVDDVQWLDAASLASLRFVLARLDDGQVTVLLAVRGDVPEWLRRAVPEERLRTIEVGGLSLGATHELLRARLDVTFPRPTLIRLRETSGGNPFFALELANALQRRGGRVDPGSELPVSDTLEGLVYERLESLTPEAQQLCRVVAALSDPTVRLVELAVDPAGRGLEEALRARVLELDGDRIRFSHPLLASAIAARTAASSKRELHQRLAALVSDTEQRARHLALAASGPDAQVAAALDAASRRARGRGAVTAAAGLAEQAHRLTPPTDVDAIRRRALVAADLDFQAGDPARAAGLLEAALADAPTGSKRAEILLHLAAVQAETAGPREAVALYRTALRETGDDARLEALIHVELADILRFFTGLRTSERHAAAAVTAAERSGDRELLCRALSIFGLVRFALGHGVDEDVMARAVALEEELGVERRHREAGRQSLCDQRFWSHDLEAARTLAEGLREAGHRRDGYDHPVGLWYLALIEWRIGNWERAAELVAEVSSIEEQLGREALAPAWVVPRAVIAAHRGFVDDARELASDALARAQTSGIATAEASYRWVLGFLELSLDRPDAALPHLRAARELRETVGKAEPGLMQELPDLLEALVAVGELGEAEAVAAPWEERARALDRAWALAICARVRALVSAARGDLEDALAVFDVALSEHTRTRDPFQHARTLLALGRTQRRAKKRGAARATLDDALAAFERLGAPLWAEQAQAERARIGGRAPSGHDLTEAERRIADLVAEGRTNREVAAALFITVHSVETALTRIYRKLGVRSRSELARLHSAYS